MKRIILTVLFIGLAFTSVMAQTSTDSFNIIEGKIFQLSLSTGLQFLTGETQEIVYENKPSGGAHHLSRLEWDQNALMIGGEVSLGLFDIVSVNGSSWMSMTKNAGFMDDYDWMGYRNPYNQTGHDPSEWTHHSLSTVEMDVQTYDVNLTVTTPEIWNVLSIGGMFGYRNESWYWTDELQSLTYSSGGYGGFRDIEMDFTDVSGINYDVETSFFYIGGNIGISFERFMVKAYGVYSPWVNITAVDNHLIRGLIFTDEFENAQYGEVGLEVSWSFLEHNYLTLGGSYSVIPEVQGNTTVQDGLESRLYRGAGGFAQESFRVYLMMGLAY